MRNAEFKIQNGVWGWIDRLRREPLVSTRSVFHEPSWQMVKIVEKLDFLDVLGFLEHLEFLVILDADALISRNSPIF